jgi:hypothetical protein
MQLLLLVWLRQRLLRVRLFLLLLWCLMPLRYLLQLVVVLLLLV